MNVRRVEHLTFRHRENMTDQAFSSPNHIRGPFSWAKEVEYSQAVAAAGLLFVSGQYGSDESGEVVSDDFRDQVEATFSNLKGVLAEAGLGMESLVSLRCYLLNGSDYPIYKEVRRKYIDSPYPASVVMCVPAFAFPGMKVEVEAVAKLA